MEGGGGTRTGGGGGDQRRVRGGGTRGGGREDGAGGGGGARVGGIEELRAAVRAAEVEGGVSDAVMAGLIERGHPAIRAPLPLGGGQVIWIDREAGTLAAGSDPRKDGAALGH